MYQPQHQKIGKHQRAFHKEGSQIDVRLRKGIAFGATILGASLIATTAFGVTASATVVEKSSTTSAQEKTVKQKSSAKTEEEIEHKALSVIRGDLGNGEIRVKKLKEEGFDPVVVQDKVNHYYQTLGFRRAGQVAQSRTFQSSNNTITTDSNVVNYAAQRIANATGVPAAQWVSVIMRESSGNPSAVNASSGAYGLFQLLGHGEYPGMSVDEQISMATSVYHSQGPGAWVAW